ncbi:hypothetical protein Acr_00g0080140 [Actinidia rufa]|uniref:Uncharacterized protein n=1 Tax=Actinidia rufa TaxID=165716 RepID=A0A7J0DUB3_9ERIC|nr:hypothetical protein Acr_00g0080140 [Actinidia rufa]
MANINHKPLTEKGKERLISWMRGKKLKITPDMFDEVFGLPHVENPEFEFPDGWMPDLDAISRELLIGDDIWDGEVQCNKMRLKDRFYVIHGLLTELFKRHGVSIPVDLTRMEPEKPIDRVDFDTRMTAHDGQFSRLEEQSGRHSTLLQEIKSMLIWMQARNDDDDEEEED